MDAIEEALQVDLEKLFDGVSLIRCSACGSRYYSEWFSTEDASLIYSVIYGQHHLGWSNLYKYAFFGECPNHGSWFGALLDWMGVRTYAEWMCPFSGLLPYLDRDVHRYPEQFLQEYLKEAVSYLKKNQRSKELTLRRSIVSERISTLVDLKASKNVYKSDSAIVRKLYLLTEPSVYCWGVNCISESVNCRALSNVIFDSTEIATSNLDSVPNIDCIGAFQVLDHMSDPWSSLIRSIAKARFIIVNVHTNSNGAVTKQHRFEFSLELKKAIEDTGAYCVDVTKYVDKDRKGNKGGAFEARERYYICSNARDEMSKIKSFLKTISASSESNS